MTSKCIFAYASLEENTDSSYSPRAFTQTVLGTATVKTKAKIPAFDNKDS